MAMIAAGAAAAAAIMALSFAGNERQARVQRDRRPPSLALLTSLPLVFGEQFSLAQGGSPALRQLERDYRVMPIALADSASLEGQGLLLMAHPRAQPAEVLVELDDWVRGGGRLLLLADPRLDWDSGLPLGHSLRPPPLFADTGLLAHWGVALDGPVTDGPAVRGSGPREVLTSSPGVLKVERGCTLASNGFIARCRIGAGRVTVVADADFLNVEGPGALDGPTEGNLNLLTDELAALAK